MAAESLNTAVVMETAHLVLRNHSQRQARPQPPGAPEPLVEPLAEPPEAPGGDLRLVKSVSESHTACPEGGGGGERRAGFWKEALSPGRGGEGRSQPSRARRSCSHGAPGQQRQLHFLSSSWLSASPSRRRGRAGASVGHWGTPPFSVRPQGVFPAQGLVQPRVQGWISPRPVPMIPPGPRHVGSASAGQVSALWNRQVPILKSEVSSCPCLPSTCLVLLVTFALFVLEGLRHRTARLFNL